MKKLKRTALMLITGIIAISLGAGAMAQNYDIKVQIDGILHNSGGVIDFGEYKPLQIDSRTYVHTLTFAENAGMKVGWDQDNQTAFIKVIADKNSDKPIEVYAAEQFDALGDNGFGTPSSITVSMMIDNSEAVFRYNYDIGEGHIRGLGKTFEMDGAATLIDDSALMVPLRNLMEILGLNVEWSQEQMTAYVSIPYEVKVQDNLEETDRWVPERYYAGFTPPNYIPDGVHEIGEYLGTFKLTKYCPCNICNGGWGNNTAWAGKIIPGQTIGVNLKDGIPKLAWLYIDGIGWRRAEDTGGGIGYHHIDVAVSSHYEATHGNIVYRDVWLAK